MFDKLWAMMTTNEVTAGEDHPYEGIEPVQIEGQVQDVLDRVRAAFEGGGSRWQTRVVDSQERRLEGTVTTKVFGFVDDVTVWLEEADEGYRVMARSKSRIGKGDLGQNARNLRSFYRRLRELNLDPLVTSEN